ncbi:ribonuclease HII [Coraliomargarita algicola]|uniref:Ribonuclease n=1 Tax=Coraliomargarita algicola TaxID=3092156 RepID=A0ABZ0RI84_9BACT|nr:ribonuclease HII [Coraliomargarita sp. J2-16]WPJ95909.1 ribonuclease HII [Coraliomargarita sp. J2-16]
MNLLQQYDADLLENYTTLIGIDEAGRGCLAGPVSAGACVVSRALFGSPAALQQSALINDSKQLSAEAREGQYLVLEQLQAQGLIDFAVAFGSVEEIAALNILGATRLAMQRAVDQLAERAKDWSLPHTASEDPLFQCAREVKLIVDGRALKPFPYAHEGLVKGDAKSLSIAMASIAAKVTRDREMYALAKVYPAYGFEQHKGYGTAVHRNALKMHGASPIHRELFLRKVLG